METDSKILITGGNGFLGRRVVKQLLSANYSDLVFPRSDDYNLTIFAETEDLLSYEQPDAVIHLAATCGGIGANQQEPGRFFYDNMAMGLNLIELARRYQVGKFIMVGTVCSYPKVTPTPFNEDSLWLGYPEETNAPYGIAKRCLFEMLAAYRQQYGFNGIALIPANLYGPGDNFDLQTSHVIPAMIRKMETARINNKPTVTLWGSGTATREFLHVKDAARAIVLALQKYNEGAPINVGAGQEITIRNLAETIKGLVEYRGEIVWDQTKPDGQPRRGLDTSRASRNLGFEPQINFEAGLKETIEWYRSNYDNPS